MFHIAIVSETHTPDPPPSWSILTVLDPSKCARFVFPFAGTKRPRPPASYYSAFVTPPNNSFAVSSVIGSWFAPLGFRVLSNPQPRISLATTPFTTTCACSLRCSPLVSFMKHTISADGSYAPIRRCSPRPHSLPLTDSIYKGTSPCWKRNITSSITQTTMR